MPAAIEHHLSDRESGECNSDYHDGIAAGCNRYYHHSIDQSGVPRHGSNFYIFCHQWRQFTCLSVDDQWDKCRNSTDIHVHSDKRGYSCLSSCFQRNLHHGINSEFKPGCHGCEFQPGSFRKHQRISKPILPGPGGHLHSCCRKWRQRSGLPVDG